MTTTIAIVGMACRYADARTPTELWTNVLAGRRAFRRLPPERLRSEDYLAADPQAPDCTYTTQAAVIEGYTFDRVRFRVAGDTYRSADLTHWLALDIAAQALDDAGFADSIGLPRETTGVLLGNSLTGEFSRAGLMRLRWPYVRRVAAAALRADGLPPEQIQRLIARLEAIYKAPFPPMNEESLAGGLSNTIAGRICNHFDLKGGGYTVDGACASSLLALANACAALASGDLDVAIAGGVDLSLDPFELVGFAKTGALAPEQMRVYDARSAGFWPGEGCGFVVLMRHADALVQQRRVYALIRGWGISSDGSGGITRPEADGQMLALQRAYRRAGVGIETIGYFEGHGTGTAVGDATELQALTRTRRAAAPDAAPAAIGSIKANIGHTKAAAGMAGLIKTVMALYTQLIPPITGCDQPSPELGGAAPALRVPFEGELWPAQRPLRAAVSGMGFGGINVHLVLEGTASERRGSLTAYEQCLLSSAQDVELFLFRAPVASELRRQVEHLAAGAARLSYAELADVAARLAADLGDGALRAAVVAGSPEELAARLETLRDWLEDGSIARLDPHAGVFLGDGVAPQIGLLFPGQAAPVRLDGGALGRRFAAVRELYAAMALPVDDDRSSTAVAQPAIVAASLAALRMLDRLGLQAYVAIGHSLGELCALHWAGAFDADTLLRIAVARGRAMTDRCRRPGAMAGLAVDRRGAEALLNGSAAVIAGMNTPHQTIISGTTAEVEALIERARAIAILATRLPVSHAFHSPLVAEAAPALAEHLARETLRPLQRNVISTITGAQLAPEADLRRLLVEQITAPVRFLDAGLAAAGKVDLWLETGPGSLLSGMAADIGNVPCVSIDACGSSLAGLLTAAGAAFALGAPIDHRPLFEGRFTRPFDLDRPLQFFSNPCEAAPLPHETLILSAAPHPDSTLAAACEPAAERPLDMVRELVMRRTELPAAAIRDDHRLLGDLHLNSIAVAQIAAEVARRLNLPQLVAPTGYADATVAALAQALEQLSQTGSAHEAEHSALPAGVDAWVRMWHTELVERDRPRPASIEQRGEWRVVAAPGHPLASDLRRALAAAPGRGVVVCLPPDPDENAVVLLLEGARLLGEERAPSRFVLVQQGGGAAAFARTLHQETPDLITCVVDVPYEQPQAVEWIVAEALAADGFLEANYDDRGRRREPVLRLLDDTCAEEAAPLEPSDVLLVTGGGKGITAECALALAETTGARLALLGRSNRETDPDLASNLERLHSRGVRFVYRSIDVADAAAVAAVVHELEAELGPITGVLHGAAHNAPQLINTLDEPAVLRTLAPKVLGLRNILAAIDAAQLRLLVTFSSIIARVGLPGEADYALANEWLSRLTERWQAEHRRCRCLSVEWSVWAGVGMGVRLGRIDALTRAGVMPIPLDVGIAMLRRLLSARLPTVTVAVAGRFGEVPTLRLERPNLPLQRFLERPRVFYPGVELVAEAQLSPATDPYLNDHIFQGDRLFPAVMGLEAMAQAAAALLGASEPPVFEQVSFERPVAVPADAALTIRVAALVREPGVVEVALRSQETRFQVDHFRAVCRFAPAGQPPQAIPPEQAGADEALIEIDPARDLYSGWLFHRGRFQRLRGYRWLSARGCEAEIAGASAQPWFGAYLPSGLLLGDPGARDAAIHAIQACVPDTALLPVGCERLILSPARPVGRLLVRAHQRLRAADIFTYDVDVRDAGGALYERWEGLRLRMVGGADLREQLVPALLGPYVERRISELIPGACVAAAVEHAGEIGRRARGNQAMHRVLKRAVIVRRRLDGRPEADSRPVSLAHAGECTLAVAGDAPLGCDMELVEERLAAAWLDLLGAERFALAEVIAQATGEAIAAAATRVWMAGECLVKAGLAVDTPLILSTTSLDGWSVLTAGAQIIATLVIAVRHIGRPLGLAVLVHPERSEE